jgi:hypothetical protein
MACASACASTCARACGVSWIQGPVHLVGALLVCVAALPVHAVARRVLPAAWLYAVSVAISAAMAWEVCAYSMLGFWNWPRLIWPCAGLGMLSVLACAVAFGLERAHPGLTSHHFRPDD